MYMKEIKFKNINIVYNDKEISKKKIFINNFLIYSSSLLVVILMLTVCFILAETIINTVVATLLSLISSLAALICGIGLMSPKHFEFIEWVRKFKYNDFEFGVFNDRYVVQAHFLKGWETISLKYFLNPEKSFKLIEDFEDKAKPLQMFIDCTKEETIVTIKNI